MPDPVAFPSTSTPQAAVGSVAQPAQGRQPAGIATGAVPFVVTAPPDLVLDASRTGSTTVTVTNLTGRPVRVRLVPRASAGAEDGWLSIDGPTELPLGVAGTVTATLRVTVPATAPAGEAQVRVEAVAEDDPEQVAVGQSARVVIPAAAPAKRRFPWPLVAIALAIVLMLAGGLTFLLLRRDPAPANTEPPVITGTATAGETLVAGDGLWSGRDVATSRQWLRCAADGTACEPVDGATDPRFDLSGVDVGHSLRVRVLASGPGGEASLDSAPTGPVQAVTPGLVGLRLNEAARAAARAGLRLAPVRRARPQCVVSDQSPERGAVVPPGTAIAVRLTGSPLFGCA